MREGEEFERGQAFKRSSGPQVSQACQEAMPVCVYLRCLLATSRFTCPVPKADLRGSCTRFI